MITSGVMRYLMEAFRRLIVTTWPSFLVALAAWISIVISIDPAGSYPSMPEGPGLTIDEMFNVQQGVFLVEHARALGWLNLVPGTSIEAFSPKNKYNPDHPPLGRYWLGLHHHLAWWIAPPFEPDGPFVTACARTGSATAFALTVWLIGAFAANCLRSIEITSTSNLEDGSGLVPAASCPMSRTGCCWDGLFASLALVLMPRVYGHAHLAALESITNFTCTLAVLTIAAWWNRAAGPSHRHAISAGVVMGLAMLTKIQAILVPVPVIVWALWRWRLKAVAPLSSWGLTAVAVFFSGWPYLWLDPVGHFLEYLGRTTQRSTIYCYYFGVRYEDKLVPWHYPFVMFAVTVPVGLHLLGVFGLRSRPKITQTNQPFVNDGNCDSTWTDGLLLACCLFPLIVFALPGVAVYDGERLFLTVFPLWAPFVGRGASKLAAWTRSRFGIRRAGIAIGLLISLQIASNLLSHPTYLSYYNLAVGGLRGADTLGLEMNYWGDAVTRDLLKRAVDDYGKGRLTSIQMTPSLHQFQSQELLRQSPILRDWTQTGENVSSPKKLTLLITFRRRADVNDQQFKDFSSGGQMGLRYYLAIIDVSGD